MFASILELILSLFSNPTEQYTGPAFGCFPEIKEVGTWAIRIGEEE